MTEMLISSPSSTRRCKGWGTGSTDFKQKLGGEGEGRKSKILKSQKLFYFSSTLQSTDSLFYLSVQHLPYFR